MCLSSLKLLIWTVKSLVFKKFFFWIKVSSSFIDFMLKKKSMIIKILKMSKVRTIFAICYLLNCNPKGISKTFCSHLILTVQLESTWQLFLPTQLIGAHSESNSDIDPNGQDTISNLFWSRGRSIYELFFCSIEVEFSTIDVEFVRLLVVWSVVFDTSYF